jgi:anti-anti-sigma factor
VLRSELAQRGIHEEPIFLTTASRVRGTTTVPIEPDPTPPAAGNPLSIDVDYDPPDEPRFAAIVSLHGEHDMATEPDVSSAIGAVSGSVLVDLSDCDFVDSIIIGTLFNNAQRIRKGGNLFELVVPPGSANVARTLELVHMKELLPIHPARPTRDPSTSREA